MKRLFPAVLFSLAALSLLSALWLPYGRMRESIVEECEICGGKRITESERALRLMPFPSFSRPVPYDLDPTCDHRFRIVSNYFSWKRNWTVSGISFRALLTLLAIILIFFGRRALRRRRAMLQGAAAN